MSRIANVRLFIDVDGVLCSRHRKGAGRLEPGLAAWRWRLVNEPPDPHPVALEALRRPPDVATFITTVRSGVLREATRAWINQFFPALRAAPLLMRGNDLASSLEVRREHIDGAREGCRVVLVDDDTAMAEALKPGDKFVTAPRYWKHLRSAIALASKAKL